jgi:hypothetical protein
MVSKRLFEIDFENELETIYHWSSVLFVFLGPVPKNDRINGMNLWVDEVKEMNQ